MSVMEVWGHQFDLYAFWLLEERQKEQSLTPADLRTLREEAVVRNAELIGKQKKKEKTNKTWVVIDWTPQQGLCDINVWEPEASIH